MGISDFQAILNAVVAIVVSLAGGVFLYLSRNKIRQHTNDSGHLKNHEQVLKDMPILHYIDRDMQAAQNELRELHAEMDRLRIEVTRLQGEINTVRAEMKSLKRQ